jgi:hypothetical protein
MAPVGETTSSTLSDALPEIIADARIIKEEEGTYMRTTTSIKKEEGTGVAWTQFQVAPLDSPPSISENQTNNNFQQYAGSVISGTTEMTQVIVKITDRTYRVISKIVSSKFGSLAGNAMARKKDEDYLALFATFATTASPGAGNPLSHGHLAAAVANITGNATETSNSPIFTVLHPYQIYDLQTEATAPIGTYSVDGMSEDVYRRGFSGTVAGSNVFADKNIDPTAISSTNGRGATHAKEGVFHISAMGMKTEKDRDMYFGGGADVLSMVDEYSFMENTSRGTQVFAFQHVSDTTAPSS